jgi:hypothetical protein
VQDFHTFGPVKEVLKGRFSSDEEVIGAVQNWLKTQPKNVLLTKLRNLRNDGTGALKSRVVTLKVILISFLYIYNKCAFFFKVPLLFDLHSYQ